MKTTEKLKVKIYSRKKISNIVRTTFDHMKKHQRSKKQRVSSQSGAAKRILAAQMAAIKSKKTK